jgi:hypothetical protein
MTTVDRAFAARMGPVALTLLVELRLRTWVFWSYLW